MAAIHAVLPFFAVATEPRSRFDPSLYPRVYRVSRGYRVFLVILAGIAVVGGSIAVWPIVTDHPSTNPSGNAIGAAVFFLIVLAARYLIVYLFGGKVTLCADAIVVQDVFTRRAFLRSNIAGWRLLRTQYVSTLPLIPRSPSEKKLKVGMSLGTDPAFTTWLADLPDLDAEELAESRNEVAADPVTGLGAALERAQQIATAKKTANPRNGLTAVSFFWSLLSPKPYLPLILTLALSPIIALVLLARSRGIYQAEGRRNDPRPSLAIVPIFPGMALWVARVRSYHLDWKTCYVVNACR